MMTKIISKVTFEMLPLIMLNSLLLEKTSCPQIPMLTQELSAYAKT